MEQLNKKVLVVEDSRVISKILVHTIQSRLQLTVECASSLEECKHILEDSADEFFVAILDLCLPDAPDGEIVDFVIDYGVPPIVLTGNLSDDIHDEMMEKPIIDYVVKRNLNEIDYIVQTIERLKGNLNRKVLVVDDSKSARTLISMLLKRHYFNVFDACNGEEALRVIADNNDISLVITDYNMPVLDGVGLTTKIRDTYPASEIAIIGISTIGSGSISVKFLKSGANDFISRPFLHEEFYCRINQNIDSISKFRELNEASIRDQLTGLYNRNYLFIAGKKLLQNAKRKNIAITIVVFDIDAFKDINSKHGHGAGDMALEYVASALSKQVRETDVLARIGNEEFCLLSVNLSEEDTEAVLNRFRREISKDFLKIGYATIPITVSVGFSGVLRESLDEMLNDADVALQQAKQLGVDSICEFKPE